jgi:uncharacterized membrane protein
VSRRSGIDWLRGIGVLIMIEAHTLDAWTTVAERARADYKWAIVLGGIGAPIFLFLAGVTLALAAGARERAGASRAAVGALAVRRGWQIFAFAFLFRLQSWVISGGRFSRVFFKVDILNIMGLSMVAAALLWRAGRNRRERTWLLGAATVALAMATPIVRTAAIPELVPDQIAWYLVPVPGFTTFALFPWAGFLIAGAMAGLWLDTTPARPSDGQLAPLLTAAGLSVALAGYSTSFLPSIYTQATFWGSSPTFFFLRLGCVVVLLGAAFWWTSRTVSPSPLVEMGRASFLVYWIHVELVYGVASLPLHRNLTFPQAAAAAVLFSLLMFGVVRLKNRWWGVKPGRAHPLPQTQPGIAAAPGRPSRMEELDRRPRPLSG